MVPKHIFVDLDGTLVRTDLFLESLLHLLKANPLNFFRIISWILRGRSYAKERVAECVDIDVDSLPYELILIEYLEQQYKEGRTIILATAAHRRYAEQVAKHLGFFESVIATQTGRNLKGASKLAAIHEIVGEDNFTYAGDSAADRPIWRAASSNILVNAPEKDVNAARVGKKADLVIRSRPPIWQALIREMRIHQYTKNILIFVPMFTSHAYREMPLYLAAMVAFLCFSLCASGVYFLNDLLDLQSDRYHVKNRNRPLASGELPVSLGIVGAVALPLLSFGFAFVFLPMSFLAVLIGYFVITTAYSFVLKRISTVDVMTLAILYTLRIVAGAAAMGIVLSSWLMMFSVFLFVSLAYLKRYIEISATSEGRPIAHGRGYDAADSETMFSLGTANFTASVVVLMLYVNSEEVADLYRSSEILWLLCLLLLYWGNRIWIDARRGKICEDPIIFAIEDKVSRIVGVGFILVALAARYIEI